MEITAEGANKDVIKDVAVSGSLWLPIEVSGQRSSRQREAEDFVALHSADIEVARASAAARAVRAYGRLWAVYLARPLHELAVFAASGGRGAQLGVGTHRQLIVEPRRLHGWRVIRGGAAR